MTARKALSEDKEEENGNYDATFATVEMKARKFSHFKTASTKFKSVIFLSKSLICSCILFNIYIYIHVGSPTVS